MRPGCDAVAESAASFRTPSSRVRERGSPAVDFGDGVVWALDGDAGKAWLGEHHGKVVDFVGGYRDPEGRWGLALVELKSSGRKVPEALKQLSVTLGALGRPLAACTVDIGAVVAFRGNAPRSRDLAKALARFAKDHRGLLPALNASPVDAPRVRWTFPDRL